jgi:hypothetical protein
MSQENVEVVRAGFDALSREDWDALIDFWIPGWSGRRRASSWKVACITATTAYESS